MQDIALIGRARTGKDTVAAHLIAKGFTRVAFADPLKVAALNINPYVPTTYGVTVRLQSLIADVGWEFAKDNYPEVRRLLQHTGQTVRDIDRGFWVRAAMRVLDDQWQPVVVSDTRYPNEADALRKRGFRLVRILRPSAGLMTDGASQHSSETAMDYYPADDVIRNDGTLDHLYAQVDALLT